MVNAEELMIGNYIYDNEVGHKGNFRVTAGDIDFISKSNNHDYSYWRSSEINLISMGLEKRKHYRKVRNGISKYSWFYGNHEIFTIEKHHCGSHKEGQLFYPTYRHDNIVFVVEYIHQVQNIIFSLTAEMIKEIT